MLNKTFLRTISRFISDNNLLVKSDKYLVALSGGADSVALTLVLLNLGYKIEAVHCNFHLRGKESDRDENFCIDFCKKNGIELHIVHFDTTTYAKLHKMSIEMAARNLRYTYFRQLKKDINAAAICVAHHQDDSVETVLINLIRGTGIHGLTGIAPKNDDVVRPLLCVSRQDIETVLKAENQDFVTDSTNFVDDVVRNKIRLDIIPLMRQINPSVSNSIAKTAVRISEAANMYDTIVEKMSAEVVVSNDNGVMKLSLPQLLSSQYAESVLFFLLKGFSFNSAQTEQILKAATALPGRTFTSSTHHLLIDRNCIIIEPLNRICSKQIKIPEEGVYTYTDELKFKVELTTYNQKNPIKKDNHCLCADFSKIKFPLIVRQTITGDRFIPFGMKGSKLVSDFLTDKKTSLFDKQRQLVITDSVGHIIWLVNQRSDNRFRITPSTKTILKISLIQMQ